MKIPIVKEWGSWVVFASSILAALIAGFMALPPETGRNVTCETVMTIMGLTCLINSKNPLASIVRTGGQKKEDRLWFFFFSFAGVALLVPFLIDGFLSFSAFSLLALSYVVLLSRGKEHHLFTELNGFALLTLSAPIVYFVLTGELSFRLYGAVFIFFAAGIFKVRVRIRKTLLYRWVMALYCAGATAVYSYLNIPVVLLLPLLENVVSALYMREEKLRTTGNIELGKSIIFIMLLGLFWE